MNAPYTQQIAQFITTLDANPIPEAAKKMALDAFADCVGVLIAGSDEEAVSIAASLSIPDNDGVPVICRGLQVRMEDAALINGIAAHVLDYDDVGLSGHPSAVIVPAVLALGAAINASGERAIRAYLVGFETWGMIEGLDPLPLYKQGFHPTAIFGTVAAAGSCAYLLNLTAEQTANALAIASSLASGLVASFGTMTKPLHVGRAAQAGLLAARLASKGFTGSPDVFEHDSGFLLSHSPSRNPALDRVLRTGVPSVDWKAGAGVLNVKRYPVCYGAHRVIDVVTELAIEHDLTTEDISSIDVVTGDMQMVMLRNARPTTGLEAKFSMQFAIASALAVRRCSLKELSDDFVTRDDIQSIFPRVSITTVGGSMPGLPFAPQEQVKLTLSNGQVLERTVEFAKGSHQLPLDEIELKDKFIDCATTKLSEDNAAALWLQLRCLADLKSLRALILQ
ncbi:MmgE/PrpD family protein [Paraburkholderia sediminicola]|uniref:MmgE/PrpD family protein n=1 Tax=Paraburkholderia rhynchosiae TaxID=487049 RepID=A0ACC7NNL7_9BURK